MPQGCESPCEFSVGLGVLLLLLLGLLSKGCSAAVGGLRAVGGVGECLWGAVGSCGRVLKSAAVGGGVGIICLLPAACCLTYDF